MIIGIVSVQHSSDPTEAKMYILAFTAGSFLYIGLAILLPELKRVHALNGDESEINKNSWARFGLQNLGIFLSWLIMLLIALYGELPISIEYNVETLTLLTNVEYQKTG